MTPLRPAQKNQRAVPYVEHFGNENDIVARLGMLAPNAEARRIEIAGPRFVRLGAWGHLLNADYLYPIAEVQRHGRRRGGAGTAAPFVALGDGREEATTPRLYGYINGGTPAD